MTERLITHLLIEIGATRKKKTCKMSSGCLEKRPVMDGRMTIAWLNERSCCGAKQPQRGSFTLLSHRLGITNLPGLNVAASPNSCYPQVTGRSSDHRIDCHRHSQRGCAASQRTPLVFWLFSMKTCPNRICLP